MGSLITKYYLPPDTGVQKRRARRWGNYILARLKIFLSENFP